MLQLNFNFHADYAHRMERENRLTMPDLLLRLIEVWPGFPQFQLKSKCHRFQPSQFTGDHMRGTVEFHWF